MDKKQLSPSHQSALLGELQKRFEKNKDRHADIDWAHVEHKLIGQPAKLWALALMEETGGEPDVIGYDKSSGEYLFVDCAAESPKGRRSICFDPEALASRKEHKPHHSAVGMAHDIGIEILDEMGYRQLQQFGTFDSKTSSWIATPAGIRKLGGALFADYRYGSVFVYHNGAESYYAARGFRGCLRV